MTYISTEKKVIIALLAVLAIITMAWFAPLQRTSGAHIVSDIGISQGAVENNSEMEIVKVNGTFWNDGDVIARNLSVAVIFTDVAHNEIARKNVPVAGDLLPDKRQVMGFVSEYFRARTVPKTIVNVTILFEWKENGQIKTIEMPLSGNEPDSQDDAGKLIYGNANVGNIEIMVLESFPVQIKVKATGYLPDGCTSISDTTKERKDSTFFVYIKTVRPADMFCTEAILPFQEVISLDVYGLKAGKYIVDVNGITGEFELATDNIIRQ